MSKGPVIIALSGGVDSAVAALLLRDAGHDVQCLHMTNWEDDGYCDAARDFQDARRVCTLLGVPLHRVNFAREYREHVFVRFLAEHRLTYVSIDAPRTPRGIPSDVALTSPVAVVRLHGRNAAGFLRQLRGQSPTVAEKYGYLYDRDELRGIVDRGRSLEGRARQLERDPDALFVGRLEHHSALRMPEPALEHEGSHALGKRSGRIGEIDAVQHQAVRCVRQARPFFHASCATKSSRAAFRWRPRRACCGPQFSRAIDPPGRSVPRAATWTR